MMNQDLTIERKNDQYPVNYMRRGLLKHGKNLKLKEQHHAYKVSSTEMEKLKRIGKAIPKAGTVRQQDKREIQLPDGYSEANHYELTDIKRLLSFLVQQNEQSRLQQKKVKEQNDLVIQEIKELKQIIEDIKVIQEEEYTREYHSFTSLYKGLLYIEERVDDISSKIEDKKNRVNWQKLFEK